MATACFRDLSRRIECLECFMLKGDQTWMPMKSVEEEARLIEWSMKDMGWMKATRASLQRA